MNMIINVVVWGRTYVELFLNLSLPTQLAPGNLPALVNGIDGSLVYRIYTTPEDIGVFRSSNSFTMLNNLLKVEFINIHEFDTHNLHYRGTLTECHAHSLDHAAAINAFTILTAPDTLYADNTFANALKHAKNGKRAVIFGYVSAEKESFMPKYQERFGRDNVTVAISPRELVELAINNPHRETLGWIYDSPTFFADWPSHLFWRVPGEGFLARGFHLGPLLVAPLPGIPLVYEAEPFMLAIDGTDFLSRAFPDPSDIYVAEDSDEICCMNVKPKEAPFPPGRANVAELVDWARRSLYPLQIRFFKHKIRLHYTDCSPAWDAVEKETDLLADTFYASLDHLERAPLFAAGLKELVNELRDSRNVHQANTTFSESSADAFLQMGTWFLQYHLPLQAQAAFIKACEVAPSLPNMHRKIIGIYREHGDEAGASWHAQFALGLNPSNDLMQERARIQANRGSAFGEPCKAAKTPQASLPPSLNREFRTEDYPHYPFKIPSIEFRPGLDMLLLELPPRHMPMMPNGLGYVHSILRTTGISYQTADCNIILYHRFHARLFAGELPELLPSGAPLPADCWDILNITSWSNEEFLDFFNPDLDEIAQKIIATAPRFLGISLNGQNTGVASRIAGRVKAALPDVIILVGGHACVHHEVGPRQFDYFDYMFIGEAELTLPPLISALMRNERPKDLPGIISPKDTPGRAWIPAPHPVDLDAVCFPTYDWTDISIYKTCDGGHTVPIAASRGCHWSRCNFCAERFAYRNRKPERVLEEICWMVRNGFSVFHFNESDVNGDPDNLAAICEGIVKKNLKVVLMGQLRIHKRSTLDYFKLLRAAGFTDLRFGVDAWSDNVLKLQCKGYTMDMVHQNLRDCHAAGIRVAVNMIIGVPGETDEDIEEYIRNVRNNMSFINSLENVNTLILSHGSEYYATPDRFNIRFRGDRETLYEEHVAAIPPEYWYSTEPYIDQSVRVARMQHVIKSLRGYGMKVGTYAEQVIHNLEEAE